MKTTLFHEIQFPVDIAYGATGGPEFLTDIITSSSGFEQRNINWLHARNRYNLAPAIKTKQQLDQLIAFFRICQGRAIGFRFKDWTDYQINNQIIAIADGKTSNFQLIKTYGIGESSVARKIFKPVKRTVEIYLNEQLVNPEIDFISGKIKFTIPPAKGSIITADAEFDVPVRFEIDHLVTRIENYNVYSHHVIPLIEIK